MIDLVAEIMPAAWAMTHRRHQEKMAAVGVSRWAIYGPGPCLHGNCGPARVKFHGNFFEFDSDGDGAFVMGVNEHPQEGLVDLLAFQPSDPTRWWLRLGQGVILGLHNARLALFEENPVFVHATPLDWLRNDCQGVTALDLSSWAVRLSHYVWVLRHKHGLLIDMVEESHGGPFPGRHGKYYLRSNVQIVGADANGGRAAA